MRRIALLLLCLVAVMAASGPLLPLVAQGSPLRFRVLMAPAPNRYTAKNGVAWTSYVNWVGRAMDSLENNKGNIGDPKTEPHALRLVNDITPRLWAVSSNPSWRGKLNPTDPFNDQYGNAMHFLLHVQGDGTVRFKYEDLSWCVWRTGQKGGVVCNTMKLTRPHSAGAWDRVDCTYGWGYDWGADKAKGGGDDSQVCGGDQMNRGNTDTTLVDELFYVGASFASAADYKYNDPVNHPNYAHMTLQEVVDDFCESYNNDAGYREIGLEFTLVGSDDNTYTYVAKQPNREFGRPMQPGLCIPYPPTPTPVTPAVLAPTPVVCTGEALQADGFAVQAEYGLCSGAQFQRRDASAVGMQSVLDAGFIDAVDVWGYAQQSVEVCFPRNGGVLVFIAATTGQRVVKPMAAKLRGDMLCGQVDVPGLIVMVEAWPGAVNGQAEPAERALDNCMVTTQYILNFRDGPDGDIIGLVPAKAKLTALARTDLWFKVDYHGAIGWISADYVDTDGDCD